MRQLKRFRDLSRRQKNRRLRQIQISENFVPDINNSNQEANSFKKFNKKASNSLKAKCVDQKISNHVSQVVPSNIYNLSENISSVAIDQSNVAHVSTFSTSSEREHFLSSKQISLRKKLILWTDKYKVEQKSLTCLLRILKSEGHNNLPNDGRTLMNTPRSTILYRRSGGYYYYGLQNGIIDQLEQLYTLITNNVIYINVNIDGLPISKSSKNQLWPILAQIVSVDSMPFLVGAYHGYGKPTTSNNFLQNFVREFKQLSTVGFTYENNVYYVKIRAVICDSPARSFVTCTKGHNGYFGCSKCIVEGDYENRRMLFLDQNCPLRTDESFKLRENPEHHIGISIFEKISLPMVTTFPLDYMHLICLGQMKKLLILWLRGSTRIKCRLSSTQIKNLTSDMLVLKKFVCSEFVRVPSSFDELDRWKATEFRVFLLYLGPVLLYKYFPYNYLKHFIAFHCAIRILCNPQDYLKANQYAKELLFYFVQYYEVLYGKDNMIYTIHSLIHLSDDAKRLGPLDSFSTFPFENHLHSLKKLLRKSEKPLPQIHRRLIEKNTANKYKQSKNVVKYPILISQNKKDIPFGCSQSYESLKFRHFKLSCSSEADRFCFLKNNKVLMINYIRLQNGNLVIIGQEFRNYSSLEFYPCNSQYMNVFVVICNDLTELKCYSANEIVRKAVLLPYEKNKFCIFPLLHSGI